MLVIGHHDGMRSDGLVPCVREDIVRRDVIEWRCEDLTVD